MLSLLIQRAAGATALTSTLIGLLATPPVLGQSPVRVTPWSVQSSQKISNTVGGLSATLSDGDFFGLSVSSMTDLDGDGLPELVVGVPGDDRAGEDRGSVFVLFLNADGTVKSEVEITEGISGFTAALDDFDYFGRGVWNLGDLDDDGVEDLIVGAYRDDDGAFDAGAAYILFLDTDATVKAAQKISNIAGGLGSVLQAGDLFGVRVAALGDLDGDGIEDAVVAASFADDGGTDNGAIYILFLNTNGTVKSQQKISETAGGFMGTLDDSDLFGTAVGPVGDVDGDGVVDLAVGARGDDDGGSGRGAVYILFLNTDGSVKGQQKISDTEGNFRGVLDDSDNFGISVVGMGDPEGDGRVSIAVGSFRDDDGGASGGADRGAVWILNLDRDGTVLSQRKISHTSGGFAGQDHGLSLEDGDNFGTGVCLLEDLNQDGELDLAVGAWNDDDGGVFGGAVWVLNLDASPRFTGGTAGPLALDARSGGGSLQLAAPKRATPGQALPLKVVDEASSAQRVGFGVLIGLGGAASATGALQGVEGELAVLPPFSWVPATRTADFVLPASGRLAGLELAAQAVAWDARGFELSPVVRIAVH